MERCFRAGSFEQSSTASEYRWTAEALGLLHSALEQVLVGLFRDTVLLSSFARSETLVAGGLTLVAFLRGIYNDDLLKNLGDVISRLGRRDALEGAHPEMVPVHGPCLPSSVMPRRSYYLNPAGRLCRRDAAFPDGRELSAAQASRVISRYAGPSGRTAEESDIEHDGSDTLGSDDSGYNEAEDVMSSDSESS
ncbi:hypothetical protein FOZ63_004736 [Perkinsus olseni]|uniref:Uncharacterized protein n=1 Tax=Perkinsus olseni TaxID=32597 RepID=A0A7J6Q3T5_PEROL|nr:hypothetical protein FOZ63_004736 [Perkinsus olseni]KAF4711917.1 hypothetical protein FOZ62_004360 [Perkinsus olseni]